MIPKIPDSRATGVSARFYGSCKRALLVFSSMAMLFFAARVNAAASVPQSSQDSNSKPAPSVQQPAATAPKPAPETQKNAPLKKAVREKKVLTEDDLAKPAEPISLKDLDEGEENNSICDLACEAALRAEFGFTPDRELEFRSQLTVARNEISNDHAWNSDLQGATDAAGLYCDLQRQKAQLVAKGTVAQSMRDEISSRFGERERDLSSQYRNYEGRLQQHIDAIQRFAPLRASIMQYEWNDFAHRACSDFKLP